MHLAARGRADSVVAFSPAGGWAEGDESFGGTLAYFTTMKELVVTAAPHADAIAATAEGRRRATQMIAESFEHIPAELIAHQIRGVADCGGAAAMIEHARRNGYGWFEADKVACPVRIVWGTEDKILRWPSAAVRYRAQLPHANWVELEGAGHCPQLDVPLESAQLVLGFTAG
jgi:pimeloyl-ACP methyl ester carboxylesterase